MNNRHWYNERNISWSLITYLVKLCRVSKAQQAANNLKYQGRVLPGKSVGTTKGRRVTLFHVNHPLDRKTEGFLIGKEEFICRMMGKVLSQTGTGCPLHSSACLQGGKEHCERAKGRGT